MILSKEQQDHWEDRGFLLLKNFYSETQIGEVNQLVDQLWKGRLALGPEYVIDTFVGTSQEKRIYFCDAPADAKIAPYKLNDLFLSSELIRQTVAGDRLASVLAELLEGQPLVCNTLNFEFGSQQDYHFDTFYMPSPTKNKMIASWIALEPATLENGPLTYYPGSHKIEPYLFSNGKTLIVPDEMPSFREYISNEIVKYDLKAETLLADKGDVLIWHSQLFHGGSEIADKSQTRRSLVTHYFTREDFPDDLTGNIGKYGLYMQRSAQPTGYEYVLPKRSWINRLFHR